MESALTPTSYTILGLLALDRGRRTSSPSRWIARWASSGRGPSRLYEEPKKLVAAGLASVIKEMVGKRPRTIYTITPKEQHPRSRSGCRHRAKDPSSSSSS